MPSQSRKKRKILHGTVGKVLALNMVNLGSIPRILQGPQKPAGMIWSTQSGVSFEHLT